MGMRTTRNPRDRAGRVRDRGASVAEYALLVGLVASACLGALRTLGGSTETSLAAASPTAAAAAKAPGGGGGVPGPGGGGGDTDGPSEEAIQKAKEEEAVAAQAAKDAAAAELAASVSVAADEVGTIYWRAKNGKSVKWATTATLASAWESAVVLDVQITRTYGDGHTKASRKSVELEPGRSADVEMSNNLLNTNKSVKDDVVMVTFAVVEVRGDAPTGELLVVAPEQAVADVEAPPFK